MLCKKPSSEGFFMFCDKIYIYKKMIYNNNMENLKVNLLQFIIDKKLNRNRLTKSHQGIDWMRSVCKSLGNFTSAHLAYIVYHEIMTCKI